MVASFEFVIPSRPVSVQTRRAQRLRDWKDFVRAAATANWTAAHQRLAGAAAIHLLYEEAALDADNIIKPIQDALVGLAFQDDSSVSDVVVRRRCLKTTFKLDGVSTVLATAFDNGGEFVYVRVDDAPPQDELL